MLHPELVRQLKAWLTTKTLKGDEPLSPVSGRVPGGVERKTSKMIRRDLAAARECCLAEPEDEQEYRRRLASDFSCYSNHDGLYADFHSPGHLFIANLQRAGERVQGPFAESARSRLTTPAEPRKTGVRSRFGIRRKSWRDLELGPQIQKLQAPTACGGEYTPQDSNL